MFMRILFVLSLSLGVQMGTAQSAFVPTNALVDNLVTAWENYLTKGTSSNLQSFFANGAVICNEGNCGALTSVVMESAFDSVKGYFYQRELEPGYGNLDWSFSLTNGACQGLISGHTTFVMNNAGKIIVLFLSSWNPTDFANTMEQVSKCGQSPSVIPPIATVWDANRLKQFERSTELYISSDPAVFNAAPFLNSFAPGAVVCVNSVCGDIGLFAGFRKRWDSANVNYARWVLGAKDAYVEYDYFVENRGCQAFLDGKMFAILDNAGKIIRITYTYLNYATTVAREGVLDSCRVKNPNCPTTTAVPNMGGGGGNNGYSSNRGGNSRSRSRSRGRRSKSRRGYNGWN